MPLNYPPTPKDYEAFGLAIVFGAFTMILLLLLAYVIWG